ncbi:MAG: hypothetical protein LQ339_004564 [Xanthoria mediterranea]|nr:MAG: hypothetical protein LQ339_004564 [Xanthoria mediterranea]
MTASTYTSVHLAKRPKDVIIPDETFTLKTNDIPKAADLNDGEVLFQSLYLSLDPAMRGWMNDTRSYIPPVGINETMRGACIGLIKASKSPSFPTGSHAMGTVGWTEYAIVHSKALQKVDVPKNGKLTDALGVLGLTGLTAYFGILSVGQVKAGDFVVVSGAAGATGSVVGQIAKIKGARVLGIAGSEDKVTWLKERLGFDDALNYKDAEFPLKFKEATKDYIDVFFDNVGGEILDLALARAKPHARFVICGAISQYNSSKPQGPKNYLNIISQRIRLEGFIVYDYTSQYAHARTELAAWLSEGKIQRKETIVQGGLAKAGEALVSLYKGSNTGKLLVEIFPHYEETRKASL